MTLAELVTYVRDLTGIYSTDLMPDTLVKRWLQEAYTELNRTDDWPWVVSIETGTISTGATFISLPYGSGRIKEVAIKYSNGELVQIVSSRGLIQTVQGDDGYTYDYDLSTHRLNFNKAIDDNVTWYVNYYMNVPALLTSGQASSIPAEFEHILAYKTAVKVLASQGDDSQRGPFYLNEYNMILETLRAELIVDEDLGPFQIGGEILRVDGRTVGRLNLRYRTV